VGPPYSVAHTWGIADYLNDGTTKDYITDASSTDQVVNVFEPIMPVPLIFPKDWAPADKSEIFATADGKTYWISNVAPHADLKNPKGVSGNLSVFTQTQNYRKTSTGGQLELVITYADLETMDNDPHDPTPLECPGLGSGGCRHVINTWLTYSVMAWKEVPIKDSHGNITGYGKVDLAHGTLEADLYGWINNWHYEIGPVGDGTLKFKTALETTFNDNVDATPDRSHARAHLNQPLHIDIPLDAVDVNEEFKVLVVLLGSVSNHRQLESFAGVRFRDPAKTTGVTYQAQGVEPAPVPAGTVITPPPVTTPPAPSCLTGTDPAAGTLQFELASYIVDETTSRGRATVWVTRGGGSKGEVSAAFGTQDGSARAGVDYSAVTSLVRFDDGEQGKRFVTIPIVNNKIVDGTRSVTLVLSDVRGCAALGTPAQATLSIIDDDAPISTPTQFWIGGSISGLAGTGLVLTDILNGNTLTPNANGAFNFPTQYLDHTNYDVRVTTQPNNPAQNCSVSNGSGLVAGADVTNVVVACATIGGNGALDTSFGSGGKVSNSFSPIKSMALQADGKIVALGGMTLSRYNADGTLDTSFGTGGKITVVANGGAVDAMQAVALQSDGKILVAGFTAAGSGSDDFVVLRYDSNGNIDSTFNTTGKVVTDFAGSTDRAYALLVQADGKIVVVGFATLSSGTNQDLALARYLTNGSLDSGFGTGGKVTTNVGGTADFGYAAAIQSDGAIVVAGRVAANGGANPDFGVVRYLENGSPDTTFSSGGVVVVDFGTGAWDEAADLVVQTDGKIVVGGFTNSGGSYRYALLRLNGNGTRDTQFGTNGLVSTPFTTQGDRARALALQANGSIVVAGQTSFLASNPNVGVARYLSTGVVDTNFGSAGMVTIDFFGGIDDANDVLIQPDSRIVVGGSARNGTTTGLGIARVLP
jgi:uncharacterized delta-60 repeat protein